MDADKAFANKITSLANQLQAEEEKVRQVMLKGNEISGNVKAKDIDQEATRSGSVEQEILTQSKIGGDLDVGDLSQKA